MIRSVVCVALGLLGACAHERAARSPMAPKPVPTTAAPASAPAATPPPSPTPEWYGRERDKAEIVKAMSAVKPQVTACFERYRVPGIVIAQTYVGESGAVTDVGITGKLAGTPTAECVANAVKGAHFRAIANAKDQAFYYPFALRDQRD